MNRALLALAVLLALGLCAGQARAQESPAVPAGGDAQDAPLVVPPLVAGGESQAARDRQAEIYESYERLVRVMEIVESRYVSPVESQKLFEGAIRGIMESLDPYSAYIPADAYGEFIEETEQQFGGIGIMVEEEKEGIRVVSTIEGMPAFRAGVQPGDFIVKVDERPVEDIGRLPQVTRLLRGPEGTNVGITLHRPSTDQEYSVILTREEIPVSTLRGYRSDAKTGKWDFMADAAAGIGYIRVTKFAQNTVDELDAAYSELVARGMKALILDFRYNPGGLLDAGVAFADRFLDTELIVRTQGRSGLHSESFAKPYDTYKPILPLVILVNEFSASASEVVGGALQDNNRAILVGNRTFGKGSVQNLMDLDGKGAIKITIAHYYTPGGKLVHRLPDAAEWGLEPDVAQSMSMEEQVKLRDEWRSVAGGSDPTSLGEGGEAVVDVQLARALEVLREKLPPAAAAVTGAGN